MPENGQNQSMDEAQTAMPRSLKELIDIVSGRAYKEMHPQEDSGIAEILPYPFLALVGQTEMKLGLCLSLINPAIGGVLLIGPRGTGKTTAVRSLLDLLPTVQRSACFYGCMPEDIETGGMDAVCPDCAKKWAEGGSLTIEDRVKLVELPLNARIEDVVGGLDERAVSHEKFRLKRGILSHADLNILYVDEVNLLNHDIVDSILDAAAVGMYSVRRGAITATYRSRFVLIGSMNPEEGNLRSQILDRFGLRILVSGLTDSRDRLEAYRRVKAYQTNPRDLIFQYSPETQIASQEIITAKEILPNVVLPDSIAAQGIELVQKLKIDSLRAEITLFEAARAFAAADNRFTVTLDDLKQVAPMALRLRKSNFMDEYVRHHSSEDQEIIDLLNVLEN